MRRASKSETVTKFGRCCIPSVTQAVLDKIALPHECPFWHVYHPWVNSDLTTELRQCPSVARFTPQPMSCRMVHSGGQKYPITSPSTHGVQGHDSLGYALIGTFRSSLIRRAPILRLRRNMAKATGKKQRETREEAVPKYGDFMSRVSLNLEWFYASRSILGRMFTMAWPLRRDRIESGPQVSGLQWPPLSP